MDQKRQQIIRILDIESAQQILGVDYRTADRYFRESGLELPPTILGKRIVPAEHFLAWVKGGRR